MGINGLGYFSPEYPRGCWVSAPSPSGVSLPAHTYRYMYEHAHSQTGDSWQGEEELIFVTSSINFSTFLLRNPGF